MPQSFSLVLTKAVMVVTDGGYSGGYNGGYIWDFIIMDLEAPTDFDICVLKDQTLLS